MMLVECWLKFCNLVNLCYTDINMGKTILLTGRPRVGKTTIIKDVVRRLPGRAGGFYTEEMRERGRRQGFKIVTLDGQEGILAHVGIKSQMRVSKYGVNLADLENVGVAAIREAIAHKDYVVIDEIGKMELFSQVFKDAVWEAVHSEKPVLGTITLASHPWADSIRALSQVTVIEVTQANRDEVAQQVSDLFEQ
jgi:nucleoside-triphosphatase